MARPLDQNVRFSRIEAVGASGAGRSGRSRTGLAGAASPPLDDWPVPAGSPPLDDVSAGTPSPPARVSGPTLSGHSATRNVGAGDFVLRSHADKRIVRSDGGA